MSIGNLKDNGNKGNNFPLQLKLLLGQQLAVDELIAINANTDNVEFLLTAILTSLQDGNDYEAKFVKDTCDGDKVYLEVRIWDPTPSPGSWGPITYYMPGSTTPVTPVGEGTPGCLQYTDPTTLLAQIYAELLAQGITLDDILVDIGDILNTIHVEEDDNAIPEGLTLPTQIVELYGHWDGAWQRITTDGNNRLVIAADSLPLPTGAATEVTLASLNAKLNSLGQKASAASAPVVLSTEQEAILATIDSVLDTIKTDTALINSNVVLGNITLNTIDAVLDTIKLDTAKLDVNLSTRATEATLASVLTELQGINLDTNGLNQETTQLLVKGVLDTIDAVLDTIKVDTGAMVIDLAAIEVLITSTNSLLTTIDTVLDAIKLDTANLDVTLSSRLNTLGQKVSASSAPVVLSTEQEAILNAIKVATEAINLDADGLALNTTVIATNALLTTIDGVLDTIKTDTAALVVDAAAIEVLLATIDTVLDTIKVDTGAIAIDLAAIEVLITSTNALLTTIDGVLDTIKLDTAAMAVDLAAIETELLDQGTSLDAMVTDLAAIETELLDQGTVLDAIDVDTGNIATSTAAIDTKLAPAVRTHNVVETSGPGSVPAGSICGSVINIGNAAGSWNGISLPPGISIPWTQIANRDTYGSMGYNASGTQFIIEYTT